MKDSSDLFVLAALVDYIVLVPDIRLPAALLPSLHLWQLWFEAKMNESWWLKYMALGEQGQSQCQNFSQYAGGK